MRVKRKEMLPGDIFVYDIPGKREALTLVVLDREREIEFWRGGMSVVGAVMSGVEFEVIS